MKPNAKELKYKEFIKLQKKYDELGSALAKRANIKLDKPYQQGWVICYDVRPDIKKRVDYPIIKEIIESGWSESYTSNVNVVRAIRQKKTQALIKNRWNEQHISSYYPRRESISEAKYKKLDIKANRYWVLDTASERYTKYQRKDYFATVPSFWLVLKVKPFMITHRRQKGGVIESEYEQLRSRLYFSGEFQSFIINYGKSFPKIKERTRAKVNIKKFMKGVADDIVNEKIPMEYEY